MSRIILGKRKEEFWNRPMTDGALMKGTETRDLPLLQALLKRKGKQGLVTV